MNNEENSYASAKAMNSAVDFNGYDYLSLMSKSLPVPGDFIVWMSRLFCPDFAIHDGRIFLAEIFSEIRYDEFREQGHSAGEAQFWVNLIELTGIFESISKKQACQLADCLVDGWNLMIEGKFPAFVGRAKAHVDDSTGEVFVSIAESQ